MRIEVFQDRDGEREFLLRAVHRHYERLVDGVDASEFGPRRNVIVFHGLGGIGKTEFRTCAASWLMRGSGVPQHWPKALLPIDSLAVAQIDLEGQNSVDIPSGLLRIRALIEDGAQMDAFDVGLVAWWSLAPRSAPARPTGRVGSTWERIVEHVAGVVGGVAGAGAGALGQDPLLAAGIGAVAQSSTEDLLKAIGRGVDKLARESGTHELAGSNELLQRVLDATADHREAEALEALVQLLGECLAARGAQSLVVVCVDATETLTRENPAAEKALSGLVWWCPSVLWVITSRDRLTWGDAYREGDPHLVRGGPRDFPGLSADALAEDQHEMTHLSPEDVETYLAEAARLDLMPPVTIDQRDAIRDASQGLPLYLEVSRDLLQRRSKAGEPFDDVVGKPLPRLVTILLRHLSTEEKRVARVASLAASFDADLLATVAGVDQGVAERFCAGSLVGPAPSSYLGYRLHDVVAGAILHEPSQAPDAWTDADRAAYGSKVVTQFVKRAPGLRDPDKRRQCLVDALRICSRHGVRNADLLVRLFDTPDRSTTAAALSAVEVSGWAGELANIGRLWDDSTSAERLPRLREALAGELPPDIRDYVERRLGYDLRMLGSSSEAADVFLSQYRRDPSVVRSAFLAAGDLLNAERFEEFESLRGELTDLGNATQRLGLSSRIAWVKGDLESALQTVGLQRRAFDANPGSRPHVEALAIRVWRGAFSGAISVDEVAEATDFFSRTNESTHLRSALAARVVVSPTDPTLVPVIRDEMDRILARRRGDPGFREWTVLLLSAVRFGDDSYATRFMDEWRAHPRQPYWPQRRLLERLARRADIDLGLPPFDPRPLADADEVEAAWAAHLDRITGKGEPPAPRVGN